jgi:hypothetical protein
MRVKMWEWVIGTLFTFNGCYMILNEDYQVRGHTVYPWVAYAVLCVGLAIPLLAWFLRSPFRIRKTKE